MENLQVEDFVTHHKDGNRTYTTLESDFVTATLLWKIWTPCILVIGCIGNTSTVIIMRRLRRHACYQHAIFLALAVSDSLILLSGGIRQWIRHATYVDIRNLHAGICALHKWLINSSSSTTAWLLTCVAVQRATAIVWLYAVRKIWTVKRTWLVIALLFLLAFSWHFHLLVGHGLSPDKRCGPHPGGYQLFYTHVYPWVDLVVSSLCPSIIQFICSLIMSWRLYRDSHKSSIADAGNTTSTFYVRKKAASRTTVTVLALSASFLMLSLPVYTFYGIWYSNESVFLQWPLKDLARLKLVSTVTHLLWYSSSAINFYLYCLTGPKYRREFLSCMRGTHFRSGSTLT